MAFIPSIRECLVQLDRTADTAAIADEIAAFDHELWGGGEHLSAAHHRLRELHQLAHHLAYYVRGGASITSTADAYVPPAKRQKRDAGPALPLTIPDGWVTTEVFMGITGRTKGAFYKDIADGKVAKPDGKIGVRAVWRQSTVDAWKAKNPSKVVA